MKNPVIETKELTKVYDDKTILDKVTFSVPQNSICGFLGPNGAGKTTSIKLFLGLIKPTSGEAKILGKDIVKESLSIRERVGYLSQDPSFYSHMTSKEILQLTAKFFKKKSDIDELLNIVGLEDKGNNKTKHFSGGERQRLGLAQAMIAKPELLILDEPAAALDPLGRVKVLKIMERIKKDTTIFFSTHILDDVQRVADYLVILNRGKILAQGEADDLLEGQENLESLFINLVEGEDNE